jgi:hypothetical protein
LKKLIAVALLAIYLFTIGGQFVLHQYAAFLSDRFFVQQTSKGLYNVHDLTEVKLPVDMPNMADWPAYENISGQIQFENSTYNYVKMRITRTALYLMCVPDYATTRFAGKNIIHAKQAKDAPVPKKEHVPYGKTTVLDNFNFAFLHFIFSSPFKSPVQAAVQACQPLTHHSPDIPEQPPRC